MVDKKKILIIGCSNGMGLHHVFRDVFKKDKKLDFKIEQDCIGPSGFDEQDEIYSDGKCVFYNLSYSGAGNTYISNRCIEYVLDNPIDYVYLQFSGINRIDLPLSLDDMGIDYGIRTRLSKNNRWIASGGYTGSWLRHPFSSKLFSYFYSRNNAYSTLFFNLLEIYKCVNFLRDSDVKFNWSCYYDYTNPPTVNSSIDGEISKKDALYLLYSRIDKSKFVEPALNYIIRNNLQTAKDQVHYPYESTFSWMNHYKKQFNFPDIG